jgi:hypothetical protein
MRPKVLKVKGARKRLTIQKDRLEGMNLEKEDLKVDQDATENLKGAGEGNPALVQRGTLDLHVLVHEGHAEGNRANFRTQKVQVSLKGL